MRASMRTFAIGACLGAALFLSSCTFKRMDYSSYESLNGLPTAAAEALKKEVGDGDVRMISKGSVLGNKRWQVFYLNDDDQPRYFFVEASGKVGTDWVGPKPFADIEKLPELARNKAKERMGDGELLTITPKVPGSMAKEWEIVYIGENDLVTSFSVNEDGRVR